MYWQIMGITICTIIINRFFYIIIILYIMNKKILIVISIVIAAIAIPFGIYTISPLFTSNTVNEPLPTTAH